MTCPICQNPSANDFSPFCSKTCKNIDLLSWLNEKYRVPSEEPITEDSAKKEGEAEEEEG